MPKPRRKDRWEHRTAAEGFVTSSPKGGDTAYAYIYAEGARWLKSLSPFRFVPSDRSTCIRILRELVRLRAWRCDPQTVRIYSDGGVEIPLAPEGPNTPEMTVKDLYDLYYRRKESEHAEGRVARDAPRKVRDAFKCYFEGAPAWPLSEVKAIREHILRKTTELALSDGTKRQYLSRLKGMFEYGLQVDLVEKNPVPSARHVTLRAPGDTADRGRNRRAYTESEYRRLLAAAAKVGGERLVLVVELFYYTGLRLQEATELRLASAWRAEGRSAAELKALPHVVPGDYLCIRGKARNGQPRFRIFPLVDPPAEDTSDRAEWNRNVWRVVDRLAQEFAPEQRGYLVGWAPRTVQHYVLDEARTKAKLPSALDIHALRHSALTIMVNELQLADRYLDRTVGNTKKIRRETYVAQASAEQLRRMQSGNDN